MVSTISVPSRDSIALSPPAMADAIVAQLTNAKADINALIAATTGGQADVHYARGIALANVAALATFTVANDGITLVAGDRVLLAAQTTASQNGIYVVGTVGGGTAPLTRATDFDAATSGEIESGVLVIVSEGTAGAGTQWELTTAAPITVGSTSLQFEQAEATLATQVGQIPRVTQVQTSTLPQTTGYGALDLANANAITGTLPYANTNAKVAGLCHQVRYVMHQNVASLASFTVLQDGITGVAGDRVLLCGQSTPAQNGLYVIGTVGGGTAPLTRPTDFAAGAAIISGTLVSVAEGTIWGGNTFKARIAGSAGLVDTNDPVFYPNVCKATVTLSSGVYALGNTEGLMLFSTTRSMIALTYNTPNTITATTGGLKCAAADRTAGVSGTAAATIKAVALNGTTDTNNVSTVDVTITN